MPREFSRGRRIADLIQRELAILIQMEVKDPRVGMITINEVKVSRDLAYADVYFTSLATGSGPSITSKSSNKSSDKSSDKATDKREEVLNQAAGFLRSRLAKILSTRTTPRLRFHYDNTIETGARMSKAIRDAVKKDEETHIDEDLINEDPIDEEDGRNNGIGPE